MRIRGAWRLANAAARLRALIPAARRAWRAWRAPSLPRLRIPRERTDDEIRERLSRLLLENILPFWLSHTIDPEGGFRQNHDLQGRWKGPWPKHIVGQARQTWFFATLARSKHGTSEHLDLARHGFEFLRDRMWDEEHGGFFWEVDAAGKRVTMPDKDLYGQAFALFALSEYAAAAGDGSALSLADDLFALLERRAHDAPYGGYLQFLLRDWSWPPPGARAYRDDLSGREKTLDTHLHVLEALAAYCRVRRNPAALNRLAELVLVMTSAVVHRPSGAGINLHARDWTPFPNPTHERVTYGHEVETVWLLVEACDALGWSPVLLRAFARSTLVHALAYGFDRRRGGLYLMGYPQVPADRREKIWWAQAEALVAMLWMYRQTGDTRYRAYFERTLDWVWDHQADWQHGDWHMVIDPRGRPSGDKAHAFKTPYHNGRAVLRCLELLDEPGSGTSP
jgi:mannobiose 2-epimerase